MERVVLGMANAVLYLKAEQNAEVMEERVCVKNIQGRVPDGIQIWGEG